MEDKNCQEIITHTKKSQQRRVFEKSYTSGVNENLYRISKRQFGSKFQKPIFFDPESLFLGILPHKIMSKINK